MNKKERLRKKRIKIIYKKLHKAAERYLRSVRPMKVNDKNLRFMTHDNKILLKYEYPNISEIKIYIKYILRYLYGNNKMNRSAYYTLKGMTRRGTRESILPVINFIKKNDTDSYMALYAYATTEKPMLHVTKKVTFNNPVQMVSIDLNLKDSNE